MKKDRTELETQIQEWLEEVKPVPPRNPQAAARGRAQFLGQAVSASEFRRHKGWISIFRKERFAMNMIVSILVIAGLLFGGATVNAAQNDLPNEPLYGLKLWSEDLGLQFQNDPEQKVERLMDLTQARIQEMTRLTDANQAVPDQVRQRLQDHIQQALQICATLDDPAMDRTLLQVRDRLQQQDRDMQQLQLHASQTDQPILLQTRTMLQQRLQLVDEGLLNHETFRYAVRNGFQFRQTGTATPPVQNGARIQNGPPTLAPAGPNTNPGGPNPVPTGAGNGPGEPNSDPGGPNMSTTPSSTTGGSGTGSNGTGGSGSGSGGAGSGNGGTGSGNNSGGNGTGGTNTGSGSNGTGGDGGGGGNGSGGQGGKP